jgi:hypothetical protein
MNVHFIWLCHVVQFICALVLILSVAQCQKLCSMIPFQVLGNTIDNVPCLYLFLRKATFLLGLGNFGIVIKMLLLLVQFFG